MEEKNTFIKSSKKFNNYEKTSNISLNYSIVCEVFISFKSYIEVQKKN